MPETHNISATRSELLLRKQQIDFTNQGYSLLDKKRLALLQELLRLQEEVVRLATEVQKLTGDARLSLAKAEASLGGGGVRAESIGNHREISIEKGDTLLMGIHLPRLRSKGIEQKFYERDFSFVGTPLIVDEMSNSFNRDIEGIIRLADGEIRLTKLLKEIFQTTRRLKALEHIVIPRLKAEYNYIRMILDERERAEHFSLKLAKKITQRKYKNKSQQSLSV